MADVHTILAVVALVFGIVSEVEDNARNWAGWGVIALAVSQLI